MAAFEGMAEGSLTCASALVPAPWFAETANLQAQNPDADIGVHLTLTAEYEAYRWRSLTGQASLHAPDAGMWRDVASVLAHVDADVARAELRAQIDQALASGIDVTHIDAHMAAVLASKYLPVYVDLAIDYALPLFLNRPSQRQLESMSPSDGAVLREQAERLDACKWPLLDNIVAKKQIADTEVELEARFRDVIADLRPGLTHLLVHPVVGGDELEGMAPRESGHRSREYAVFRRRDLRDYAESLGIHITGYRAIRDRLRAGA
jgi:predicted glycoside hydrolase/deacetylase ChbG (UPF0249 family)